MNSKMLDMLMIRQLSIFPLLMWQELILFALAEAIKYIRGLQSIYHKNLRHIDL